ncbi:MAG: hypothetical protein LCH85_15440 [Chloroflexi bacterium]|nr:hypothetical protein [Chloroflexota bacterium]
MYTIPSSNISVFKIFWFGIKKSLLYALIGVTTYILLLFMLGTLNLHLNIVLYGISIIFSMYIGLSFLYSMIALVSLIKSDMLYIHHYMCIFVLVCEFHLFTMNSIDRFFSNFAREPMSEQFINTNKQIFTNIIKPENINQWINSIMFISPAIIVVLAIYRCQQQKQFYQQDHTIPNKKHLNRD